MASYTNDSTASAAKPAHSTEAEGDRAATCTELAYCSVCKSEYGDYSKNKHNLDDDGYCTDCGKYIGDGTKIEIYLKLKAVNAADVDISGNGNELNALLNGIDGAWVFTYTEFPFVVNIGTNTLSGWDLCPEGYVKPADVTFTVAADGTVTCSDSHVKVEKDGDCTVLVITLAEERGARIEGATLTIGENLAMNYYVSIKGTDLLSQINDITMYFEMSNGKTATTNGVYDELTGHYVFTLDKLPPQPMGATIDATLKLGDEVLAEMEGYSIKAYAEYLLTDSTSTTKLKQLVSDMLHYGAAAQVYTNYRRTPLSISRKVSWMPPRLRPKRTT